MNVLFSKKNITVVIIILVTASIIFILSSTVGGDNLTQEETSADVTPVRVITAEYGSLDSTLRLNGYVQSDNLITIIPFVSGRLEELSVEVGETVTKGQPVARIDSRAFDLQLLQAEAAYLGAKSSYERLEQLFNSNAATRQSFDQAKSQYDAYKSQYELAQLQVSYTNISAPIDGTVLMIHANQGSIAAPELPVLTIGDLSNLIVNLSVPDKYYELFRTSPDMKMRIFRPENQNAAVTAGIKTVSPIISPETRTFEVSCTLNGDLSGFRPGMFVYCVFNVDHAQDVYYLPHNALSSSGSLWYVEPETSTAEKFMFTSTFSNQSFFSIPEEISGYNFIIEGQSFLTPGQVVKIK